MRFERALIAMYKKQRVKSGLNYVDPLLEQPPEKVLLARYTQFLHDLPSQFSKNLKRGYQKNGQLRKGEIAFKIQQNEHLFL